MYEYFSIQLVVLIAISRRLEKAKYSLPDLSAIDVDYRIEEYRNFILPFRELKGREMLKKRNLLT